MFLVVSGVKMTPQGEKKTAFRQVFKAPTHLTSAFSSHYTQSMLGFLLFACSGTVTEERSGKGLIGRTMDLKSHHYFSRHSFLLPLHSAETLLCQNYILETAEPQKYTPKNKTLTLLLAYKTSTNLYVKPHSFKFKVRLTQR